MQSFHCAVDRAIKICGADILNQKNTFLNVVEDLVPYHEADHKFLKKTYDSDLGSMLKKAYDSADQAEQYYNDILTYLLEETGLNEKKAAQFVSYFSFLTNGKQSSDSDGKNQNKADTDRANGTDSTGEKGTEVKKLKRRIMDALSQKEAEKAAGLFEESEQLLINDKSYYMICTAIGARCLDVDPKKARVLLMRAANRGKYPRAMALLGYMHYYGKGVIADYVTAFDFFSDGAELGDGNCMKGLGKMYEKGDHVQMDLKKALYWYDEAAKHGEKISDQQYNALLEKIQKTKSIGRVMFTVLNKDTEKQVMYFDIGEEIPGKRFSEHLSNAPVFKLLYNEKTKQVGIRNLSDYEWKIVRIVQGDRVSCPFGKVVPIEPGDMIKIIDRVVQLNVIKVEKEN